MLRDRIDYEEEFRPAEGEHLTAHSILSRLEQVQSHWEPGIPEQAFQAGVSELVHGLP
jgi:hypothetical protein